MSVLISFFGLMNVNLWAQPAYRWNTLQFERSGLSIELTYRIQHAQDRHDRAKEKFLAEPLTVSVSGAAFSGIEEIELTLTSSAGLCEGRLKSAPAPVAVFEFPLRWTGRRFEGQLKTAFTLSDGAVHSGYLPLVIHAKEAAGVIGYRQSLSIRVLPSGLAEEFPLDLFAGAVSRY